MGKKGLKPFDLSGIIQEDRPITQDEMMVQPSQTEPTKKTKKQEVLEVKIDFTTKLVNKVPQYWLDAINKRVEQGIYISANKVLLEAIASYLIEEKLIDENDVYASKILASKKQS